MPRRSVLAAAIALGWLGGLAASTCAAADDPPAPSAPPAPRYGLSLPRTAPAAPPPVAPGPASPYHSSRISDHARDYYRATWGIDRLRVSYTMSGNLLRFSFHVIEPKLAKALGDHEATPKLYAPAAHLMLQVPNMEQIGPLRQLHTDKADEDYWLLFSNRGNVVHKGDRVNVIIGKFHADGLVVE